MTVTFTVPVTVVTRVKSGVNGDGNDVFSTTSTVVDGVFAPGGSTEVRLIGDQVTTQPTVFLPAGTAVTAIDYLTVGGLSYEVDGDPQDWSDGNPFTGWAPDLPVVVALRRVTG